MASPNTTAGESAPDDAALVESARTDPAAFGALYERYLAPVYHYCYLRLGSRSEAEDATAKVFLKALAGLRAFRGGMFAAWLFRIARHVLIDLERARRPALALEALGEVASCALAPEADVLISAEREALRAALAALPPEQRTVLELDLAGWRGDEIAASLGKSSAAVKMLRLRGTRRLRDLLGAGEKEVGGGD